MTDEMERRLKSLVPRGAPPELRDRALAAAGDELSDRPRPRRRRARWDLRLGTAVAASLVLAVAMNHWAISRDDAAQARLFGPDRLPESLLEIVETTESVGGPEAARLVEQQLTRQWQARRRETLDDLLRRQREFQQALISSLEYDYDVPPAKGPEVDRDRPGRTGDRAACGQRDLRFA